jgi:hypothetical protein
LLSRFAVAALCAGTIALVWGARRHIDASAGTLGVLAASASETTTAHSRASHKASATHHSTARDTTNAERALLPARVASTLTVSEHGAKLTLRVVNLDDRQVEINFPTGQTHDFVVVDSTGAEVWRWSQGRLFTSSLQNMLVGAHDTVTFEEEWDPRHAARGRYVARADLRSSNFPVQQRADFVLP